MIQSEVKFREHSAATSHLSTSTTCPLLVDRWELTSQIAAGPWSAIYRARPANSTPDNPAAYVVKLLSPERATEPDALQVLAREARVGRRVSHPHLIAILESQLRRAPQYLVMPWLEGATLQSYTISRRLPDPPAVLWIARQMAEALDALDQAGWTHGDIKPSNVLLSPQGHVTLLDLGFARHRDESRGASQAIVGTGLYLALEHFCSSLRPDIRSDIYSMGIILYQLLAGRLPLEGQTLEEMAVAHKQQTPVALHRIAAHVPTRVAALVHRMLAKDPLRRPQSPKELVDELVRLEIETFSERAA